MLGMCSVWGHRIWDRSLLSLCWQLQGFVAQMLFFTPHIPHPLLASFIYEQFCDVSVLFSHFTTCFSVSDLRPVHTLPHTCAEGCVPPGSGSANSLQHTGGQDQPGSWLPGRGSSEVAYEPHMMLAFSVVKKFLCAVQTCQPVCIFLTAKYAFTFCHSEILKKNLGSLVNLTRWESIFI